jgi:SAM-dependent methyltransferase
MREWLPYQQAAALYASAGEDDPTWRERQRARFVALVKGRIVADLGCGPGYDLAAFAVLGLDTVGIDGAQAMLNLSAQRSPATRLFNCDLRAPLPVTMDGIWSMFTLLHLPPFELPAIFQHWREALTTNGALALGLVESPLVEFREVQSWLDQKGLPSPFYYHRALALQALLEETGFVIEEVRNETPERYRGGAYDEFQLSAYVIFATRA